MLNSTRLISVKTFWRKMLVSERLLKLLDADSDQQRTQMRAQIRELLGFPPSSTASSAIYQDTEQGQQLLYGELNYPQIPGQLWHGEWEQVAKSLSEGE